MAGEIGTRPSAAEQPGGRSPAPGQLSLVQAFLNTHYDLELDHGAEVLSTPAALRTWLVARGLLGRRAGVVAEDLARALAVREALRELARGNGSTASRGAAVSLNAAARDAPVELRFDGQGAHFTLASAGGVPAAIGLLLAITATAMIDGSWHRLKICPGHDCDWAFYDHSRNQTGRWCSMSVCGSRAKARSHYRRRRARERAE